MYKPPYWFYDNIKVSDNSIEKLRENLSEVELIDNHKTT